MGFEEADLLVRRYRFGNFPAAASSESVSDSRETPRSRGNQRILAQTKSTAPNLVVNAFPNHANHPVEPIADVLGQQCMDGQIFRGMR
jgi:hypothetical protein